MKSILLYEPNLEKCWMIHNALASVFKGRILLASTTCMQMAKALLKARYNLIICRAEKRSELPGTQRQNFVVYYDSVEGVPALALQVLEQISIPNGT